MLSGELTKIMLNPLCCNWRDKAKKGITWLWAMNGNITMVSFLLSVISSSFFRFFSTMCGTVMEHL